MKKFLGILGVILLMVGLLAGCGESQSGDYPRRSMEFVVPYSAGGGSDILARQITDIITGNNFTTQPIMVNNRTGGSGAVGNAYTYAKKDDYTLMTMTSGQALSARVNGAEVTADMFTPIALLAMDNNFLVVKSDSPYETIEEAIEAAKKNPRSITIGGVGTGSENHLLWGMLQETGAEFRYVPYEGGGELASALLGGHVDMSLHNPGEIAGHVEAGTIRPLATFAPQRVGGLFAEYPTFMELGYDISFQQFRSVVGPPGMSEEAVSYWSKVLQKVTETEQWKKNYIERFLLTDIFMGSEEYKEYHEDEEQRLYNQSRQYGIIE